MQGYIEEEFWKRQREIIALKKRLKVSEIKEEAEFQIVGYLRHNINPKLAMVQGPVNRVYKLLESKNLLGESTSRNLDGTEEKTKDVLDQALGQLDLIKNILDKTKDFLERKIDRKDFPKS